MTEVEDNRELPNGWIWTELNNFADIIFGQSPPSSTYNDVGIGLPFYQGKLEFGSIYPTPRKWCSAQKKIAKNGDVLISVRAPVGPTNLCLEESCIGRGLAAIRGKCSIDPFFILYSIRSVEKEISNAGTGSTFNAINGDQLRQFRLPLPPLPEQHRIVSRIDELFSRLDAGVEALRRTKVQLQRYRQSVLQAAVTGRLTVDWRKAHPEVEPAEELVNEIGDRTFNGGGSKRSLSLDVSGLPELPDSWIWTSIGKITDLTSGKAFKKDEYSKDGVRLFQIANVSFGKIIWDNLVYMPQDYLRIYPNLSLNPGDILMALNRPILDGRLKIGCLGEQDIPSILYQRVGRFDFYDNSIAPYFFFFAQSPNFINMLKDSLQGVDQPFINKPRLLNLPMALPPKQEQCQIISEIERHISVAVKIEDAIEVNLKSVSFLRQSILQHAFQGKLVPQDPHDEPASLLLERIRAERIKESPRRGRKSNTIQSRPAQ